MAVKGDDIAWMRFDEKGILHAINPENGFFGVCPGTNMKTNPNAMLACQQDCIFTNVAETKDGGIFWEGLEDEVDNVSLHLTRILLDRVATVGEKYLENEIFCRSGKSLRILWMVREIKKRLGKSGKSLGI